jgi:hypothetical protein
MKACCSQANYIMYLEREDFTFATMLCTVSPKLYILADNTRVQSKLYQVNPGKFGMVVKSNMRTILSYI